MKEIKKKILISSLHRVAANLEWRDIGDSSFATSFPNYSLSIREAPAKTLGLDNGEKDYIISIYNETGEVINQIYDDELVGDLTPKDEGYYVYFHLMRIIYTIAYESVNNVDEALDTIIKYLEDQDLPF